MNVTVQKYISCDIPSTNEATLVQNIGKHIPLIHLIFLVQPESTHAKTECTFSWWRHPMETFSASQAICTGNSPVPGEFPAQRPVTRSFDVFFDPRPNERLSKQSWGWWFETLSHNYDVIVMWGNILWLSCCIQCANWLFLCNLSLCVMISIMPIQIGRLSTLCTRIVLRTTALLIYQTPSLYLWSLGNVLFIEAEAVGDSMRTLSHWGPIRIHPGVFFKSGSLQLRS